MVLDTIYSTAPCLEINQGNRIVQDVLQNVYDYFWHVWNERIDFAIIEAH